MNPRRVWPGRTQRGAPVHTPNESSGRPTRPRARRRRRGHRGHDIFFPFVLSVRTSGARNHRVTGGGPRRSHGPRPERPGQPGARHPRSGSPRGALEPRGRPKKAEHRSSPRSGVLFGGPRRSQPARLTSAVPLHRFPRSAANTVPSPVSALAGWPSCRASLPENPLPQHRKSRRRRCQGRQSDPGGETGSSPEGCGSPARQNTTWYAPQGAWREVRIASAVETQGGSSLAPEAMPGPAETSKSADYFTHCELFRTIARAGQDSF